MRERVIVYLFSCNLTALVMLWRLKWLSHVKVQLDNCIPKSLLQYGSIYPYVHTLIINLGRRMEMYDFCICTLIYLSIFMQHCSATWRMLLSSCRLPPPRVHVTIIPLSLTCIIVSTMHIHNHESITCSPFIYAGFHRMYSAWFSVTNSFGDTL